MSSLSKIQSSQFHVMLTKLRSFFFFGLHFKFSRFRPKINVRNARNCLSMFKTNQQTKKSVLKRTFHGILNQCRQKHGMRLKELVYITKNIVSSLSCLLLYN